MGFLIETGASHRETENSQAEKLCKLTEDPREDSELQQSTNKASHTVRRTIGSTGKELILGPAVSCAAPKAER